MRILIVCLIILIIALFAYPVAQKERNKCENAGGIYYSSFFGADNCVFPPK